MCLYGETNALIEKTNDYFIMSFSASEVIAISAVVVALSAFIVSVWQGISSRKHNRLSVKPLVDINLSTGPSGDASVALTNSGVGPALLQSFSVLYQNKKYIFNSTKTHNELFKSIGVDLRQVHWSAGRHLKDAALGVGESIIMLNIEDTSQCRVQTEKMYEAIKTMQFEVEYQSIYGEVYSYTGPSPDDGFH